MALKLRRGTDEERQTVVFAEGELIYTTDTRELYIGDGNTLGGIRVTGSVEDSPIALTRNLSLGSHNINGAGNISVTGTVSATNFVGNGSGLTNLPLFNVVSGGDYKINIVGADSSVMVNSDTGEFTGSFIGDGSQLSNILLTDDAGYKINVVGHDFSVIVNSSDKSITTSTVYATNNSLTVLPDSNTNGENLLNVVANNDRAILKLTRHSEVDITNTNELYGSIFFERDDPIGALTTGIIIGTRDGIYIASDNTGAFDGHTWVTVNSGGNLALGAYTATEKLDVRGNGKFTGFVQFGSLTNTQRDALTPANGMIIYNSSNNQFEGYQNGEWVKFNTSPLVIG